MENTSFNISVYTTHSLNHRNITFQDSFTITLKDENSYENTQIIYNKQLSQDNIQNISDLAIKWTELLIKQEEEEGNSKQKKGFDYSLWKRGVLLKTFIEVVPTEPGRRNIILEILLATVEKDTIIKDFDQLLESSGGFFDTPGDGLSRLISLAEMFFYGLIIPIRARGGAPTPIINSYTSPISELDPRKGQRTKKRLVNLREACLERDHHRCIITKIVTRTYKKKHQSELNLRSSRHIRVAHIIPHSLNQTGDNKSLPESKPDIWRILNMFDPGLSYLVLGDKIDSPLNAITLDANFHLAFGALEFWLEPFEDNDMRFLEKRYKLNLPKPEDCTIIHTIEALKIPEVIVIRNGSRVISGTPDRPVYEHDWPSDRLIRIHAAIATVAHLSGAGDAAASLLEDYDAKPTLSADGSDSNSFAMYLSSKLGGIL